MKKLAVLTMVLYSVTFPNSANAVTGNSGSANEGFGYYITDVSYSTDEKKLLVMGFFVNATDTTVAKVKMMRLNINGRDGFVTSQTLSGGGLDTMNLKPGANREWSFTLLKPNKGKDISRIDYNVDCDLENGSSLKLSEGIKVYYHGAQIPYDVRPAVINGRTMIPARLTFERMGASVFWDDTLKKVTVKRGEKQIEIKIGETRMVVNGAVCNLQVPAQVIEGRTMIPLRAVASALDCVVNWGDANQMVVIVDAL